MKLSLSYALCAFAALRPALAALTWKTYDISSLILEEDSGVTYKTSSGTTQALEVQAKNAGANSIKIRVYVPLALSAIPSFTANE